MKSNLNRCWWKMSLTPAMMHAGRPQPIQTTCDFATTVPLSSGSLTEVPLLQLKWTECSFTGLPQCVNVLGQKSHLGSGLRTSNGGFTRLINKP